MIQGVQSAFLPGKNPVRYGAVEVAYCWEPCPEEHVSGDYFYCQKLGDSAYVEIGDVQGHGVHSALAMTALHGVLWGLRQSHFPLPALLASVNRFLHKLSRPDRLMSSSFFMCRINLQTGILEYSNAGHPAPIYISASPETPTVLELTTGGLLLGLDSSVVFEAGTLAPEPGDLLFLFTDGVSECENTEEQQFADGDRLRNLLLKSRDRSAVEVIESVRHELDDFRGPKPRNDDLAMAAVKFGSAFSKRRS